MKILNLISIILMSSIIFLITYNVIVNGVINYVSFNGI